MIIHIPHPSPQTAKTLRDIANNLELLDGLDLEIDPDNGAAIAHELPLRIDPTGWRVISWGHRLSGPMRPAKALAAARLRLEYERKIQRANPTRAALLAILSQE